MGVGLVVALLLKELPLRTTSYVEEANEGRAASPREAVPQEKS